ncbi:MAG: hypothetical protein RhofKO_09430 [Rhodothermales bacterium]
MLRTTLLVLLIVLVSCAAPPAPAIQITEVTYEDRPHFQVTTPAATYVYDQAGGGFSRIIDPEGNDWVAFKMEPWGEYPPSAASAYRGLPNLVFQGADGGAGHPGFDQTTTEQLDATTLRTTSTSGLWQWTVRFTDDRATLTVDRADTTRGYWFLYEGPVGGTFSPATHYWGTDVLGHRTDTPDLYAGEAVTGQWQWAFFGDTTVDRVFYVHQTPADTLTDTMTFLGNTESGMDSPDGMVVFGFGRDGIQSLMRDTGNTFTFGFYEQAITSTDEITSLEAHLSP